MVDDTLVSVLDDDRCRRRYTRATWKAIGNIGTVGICRRQMCLGARIRRDNLIITIIIVAVIVIIGVRFYFRCRCRCFVDFKSTCSFVVRTFIPCTCQKNPKSCDFLDTQCIYSSLNPLTSVHWSPYDSLSESYMREIQRKQALNYTWSIIQLLPSLSPSSSASSSSSSSPRRSLVIHDFFAFFHH